MTPIYQAYVDAIKSQQEMQIQQQELQMNKIKTGFELMGLQQQLQERQIAAKIWGNQKDPNAAQGAAGGAQPDANPSTGQDPSLGMADKMDQMGQALARVNPQKAEAWFTKASTLRNQYYTRVKDSLAVNKQQADVIGSTFGTIDPNDQVGYTAKLQELSDRGVDIGKFGLSGNVQQDMPKLKSIAESTLSYNQKLEAQHRTATEQQSLLGYQETVRHHQADEGLKGAQLSVAQQSLVVRTEWDKANLDFHARADARAQAGFDEKAPQALAKAQEHAGRVNSNDMKYTQSLVESDPTLGKLSDPEKKAAAAEIALAARGDMQRKVTKPGDLPTADDFMASAQKAAGLVAKRVTPGKSGFLGFGSTAPSRQPLPPIATSKEDVQKLPVGEQFRFGDKMYKKTSATDVEEIK